MGCRWSITNHAEDAILTDSKGKTYTNFSFEETLILGDDSVLKVGEHQWSTKVADELSLKARNSSTIKHSQELTTANSCASLGRHMVYVDTRAKLLEMSVPNEDTKDYGNIDQFDIDQCSSSLFGGLRNCDSSCARPKDFVISNRSDHIFVVFVDHCCDGNVFKLLPGQRTKYRGSYCRSENALTLDGTWAPKAVLSDKSNPRELIVDNNPGYLVQVSNKTSDAITCRTDKGNVLIPSRSFLECSLVTAMFTLEGNQLPPFQARTLAELDLDGYHFVIDTTKYPTKVTVT